ncbi:MAG: NupC/NupG family nucleoside CNT transporter [bacterium]|nr:NupC/NupG family nucleoside CNT transporter [bacterium]
MRWISILGLLVLLGIAWLMSSNRKAVRPRVVVWGIALQVLFAVIILEESAWSFVGMGILGILIVVYILRGNQAAMGGGWAATAAQVVASVLVGSALATWLAPAIPGLVILTMLWLIVNAHFRLLSTTQPYAGALLIVSGVAYLVSQGLYGQAVFTGFSGKVAYFLSLSDYGAEFLFGNLARSQYFISEPGAGWPGFGVQFAFKVLPTIVFFGGFMGVLYHLGVMQRVVEAMARFMRWTIGTSGAETLSCSANIFVGQTEAPLLIKPFLPKMTKSELLTIMVGGFATIAGGVLAGYIVMGIDAGHLIAASVMSAPAALVVGKILYPETEESATAGRVELPDIDKGGNVIEAATNGISDGFKLALNVGAMLIGFIALVAVADVILNWFDRLIDGQALVWLNEQFGGALERMRAGIGTRVEYGAGGMSPIVGEFRGVFPGSLQTVFGTVLRPLAWLMGVPWQDAALVGNLLGTKISLNEFVAYGTLGSYIQEEAFSDPRSLIIATYALCGFANFSSIGIQIGGISAIAPERKSELAKLGLKAMFGGAIASWLTATIAGILL